MAITSWTSEGMDWSSVDSLRLDSLYSHCEAIRLALRERQLAAGLTPSGIFTASYEIQPMKLKSFCDSVQSAITTLIPCFTNHTDNSGDWDAVAYSAFAPAWTSANLIATIGASSRLTADSFSFEREWLSQQYQILNMLRLIKIGNTNISMSGGYKRLVLNDIWDDAVNEFNSSGWTSYSVPLALHSVGISSVTGGYVISRYYGSLTANSSSVPLEGTLDWYCDFTKAGDTTTYQNNDYSVPESYWKKIWSGIDKAASVSVGYFGDNTQPMPTSGPYEWRLDKKSAIYKPAFAFKDW